MRVREVSNKAPDNLLNQNDLKKETGNADAPKQTLNRQVEILQKEVVVDLSAKMCAENELERLKSLSGSISNLS
eukprot:4062298-Ditylum_brightwellii.AAC.1